MTSMPSYETFDHTADIGLRIYGRTLPELFENAARGLFSLIAVPPPISSPAKRGRISAGGGSAALYGGKVGAIHLQAQDLEELLFDWLRELLYQFSTKRILFNVFDFKVLDGGAYGHTPRLECLATGPVFDPSTDEQLYEVKAVTHHQFKLEKTAEGWKAEVILDI